MNASVTQTRRGRALALFVSLSALVWGRAAAAEEAPSVHLTLGTPTDEDPSDDELMIKPEYALSYNRERNTANWVSWELNASYLGAVSRYRGPFLPDQTLPEGWYRVEHSDYRHSGYDRGHLVPSEDRTRTPDENVATFLLTNVLPQAHELNIGPWLRLEEYCHALAAREDRELFVMAGGVFSDHPATIGHGVSVPEAFFKIVVVLDGGEGAGDVRASTRVIAVLMPNTSELPDASWSSYRTTVSEIERRTGYAFLTRVPDSIRSVVEDEVDDGPIR